ncbi:MAG TPA: NBR1-Ig-like domain-containing protein [Anaerolineales bacterium]|nr:NBR1-Ig-like domain-containing protein [Anaerolineales bacterium]
MSDSRLYRISVVVITMAVLMAACAPSQPQESTISTAVAQTVQAQNASATLPAPTPFALTDTPSSSAPLSTAIAETPATQAAVEFCTASAAYVGENYPDGTILQPGMTFTKIWHIQNTGTCAWDKSWQLVFNGGDRIGGAATYNLPQPVQPGQTVDVPVILAAPTLDGSYKGEWMLKSPWGKTFGVGQYDVPLSVSIVVGSAVPANKKTETVYGVTAVTYNIVRNCVQSNTFYEMSVNITTNGPVTVRFSWLQSDGNNRAEDHLTFTEATTLSRNRQWIQGNWTSPNPSNPRWVQVIILSPVYQEIEKQLLPPLCK